MSYRKKRADVLLELVPVIENSTNMMEALQFLQNRISSFVKAERSSLYLFEEDKENPSLVLLNTLDGQLSHAKVSREISTNRGIIGYVIENRKGVFVNNLSKDKRFKASLYSETKNFDDYKTRSYMVFPLLFKNNVIGIFTVPDRSRKDGFTKEEFALVRVVAMEMTLMIKASMQKIIFPQVNKSA